MFDPWGKWSIKLKLLEIYFPHLSILVLQKCTYGKAESNVLGYYDLPNVLPNMLYQGRPKNEPNVGMNGMASLCSI